MKAVRANGAGLGDVTRAFTLLELMLVVALIGIVTAMILPEMRGTLEDARLRSASRQLVDVCGLAYSRAVALNQMHRVRLDRATGRYVLERRLRRGRGEPGFVPVKDVTGGAGRLDNRITVGIRRLDENSDTAAPDANLARGVDREPGSRDREDTLVFYPDGTADAAEVLLRSPQGFQLALRINPVTAQVRVTEARHE